MGKDKIVHLISKSWLNPRIKQVALLFIINIIGIPLGIFSSIILTRYLGPVDFGNYQFINNIFNTCIVIFAFGFFQACNRMLVLNNDVKKSKEYYGAALVVLIGLFLIMSICLILYACFDSNIQEKNLQNTLLYILPFSWVYLLTTYFEVLFQADNQIRLLAFSRILPKIGFLLCLVIVYHLFIRASFNRLTVVCFLSLLTQAVAFIYILRTLKISFKNIGTSIKAIWKFNKSYGFDVYLGSLFGVGFSQLTGVLISYFGHDNAGVGYFSLALTFATPLSFIPQTIATTNYKQFASHSRIPSKLVIVTIILSIASLFLLWLIIPPFIHNFYGPQYSSVIYLNFIISIGVTLWGMADFFNRYLGAQGQGKLLRNSSILVGFSSLLFNLILIPNYGERGAAYTRLLGGMVYLSCMLFYYKKAITVNSKQAMNHSNKVLVS